jgi:hypothetical protein
MVSIFIFTGCSSDNESYRAKIADLPYGVTNLKNGYLVSFSESHKASGRVQKISFMKSEKNGVDSQEKPSSSRKDLPQIISYMIDGKIRLIDFYIQDINNSPKLGFESTARSLVFINPLVSSLPMVERIHVFSMIHSHKKYSDLVRLISRLESLEESEIIQLSSDIAFDLTLGKQESSTSTNIPTIPSQTSSTNFDQNRGAEKAEMDFPRNTCGDELPTDASIYPVDVYPVYIPYSDSNLKKVKSSFCNDAFQIKREKTGGKSILVASFLSLEKAERFRLLMKNEFGGGEVGKPSRIEAPRSSMHSLLDFLLAMGNKFSEINDIFMESAQAQEVKIIREYTLVSDFDNHGQFPSTNWPLWHGMKLEMGDDGPILTGTSPIAQQLVVMPDKVMRLPIQKLSDLNGSINKIVSEQFIPPAEIGFFDFNLVKTLSGNNSLKAKLNQKLKDSIINWEPGDYDVLISGWINLRTKDRVFGAFDMNMIMFASDVLEVSPLSFLQEGSNLTEKASQLTPVFTQCLVELDSKRSLDTLFKCIQKPDNLFKIAKAFGLPEDMVIRSLLADLVKLKGKAWEGLSKRVANSANLVAKGASLSRIALFGMYNDAVKPYYLAKFRVIDPTRPEPLVIDCKKDKSLLPKIHDLQVVLCRDTLDGLFLIEMNNFSGDWYEVSRETEGVSSGLVRKLFEDYQKNNKGQKVSYNSLIGPGDRTSLEFTFPKSRPPSQSESNPLLDSMVFTREFFGRDLILELEPYPIDVQRYQRLPSRQVEFKCDDAPKIIWDIAIAPQCSQEGTFARLSSASEYPILVTLDSGKSILLKPIPYKGYGMSGKTPSASMTITSNANKVQVTFSVVRN